MINQTICSVAGKSGGHIIPCLTLAQTHKYVNSQLKTLFFSAKTPLDKRIITDNKQLVSWHVPLPLSSIARQSYLSYVTIFWNCVYSFICSVYYLCKHRPQEIITTGGVVALPVCYAGFLLRIPITIHCLDAVPGKAIKAIAPIASKITVCFAHAQRYVKNTTLVSYPIKYTRDDHCMKSASARKKLGLDPYKKTIVILGGSQGSLFLNECIKKWTKDPSFASNTVQIIHQTGSIDSTDWKQFYKNNTVTAYVFSYQSDISLVYAAADIIICRAGAGTLFEIQFFNKKCIVIPLTTQTTSHQVDNARAITQQYPDLFCWIDQQLIEKQPNILFSKLLN
jgi:UDP-N-acetylglucosamine--N-acetylmuramyl-(pentapeptide) pyrophosphoryl-undecaprenol N-acetylglucosamine transferase